MKKLIVSSFILSAFLFSCKKENASAPANPTTTSPVQNSLGMHVISNLQVGEGTVTFLGNGTDIGIITKNLPGKHELLGAEMYGLSLSMIFQKLSPGTKVPEELLASKERFCQRSDNSAGSGNTGAFREPSSPEIAAERNGNPSSADLNDAWFSANYCNPPSFWNGYSACLLNRTPERGLPVDWAWANATRSTVYVYPYKGHQIHLQGQVDGSTLFDVDLLSGSVYSYWMFSGTSFWGCRQMKKHYYSITNTYGCGWHWSLRSNTDC